MFLPELEAKEAEIRQVVLEKKDWAEFFPSVRMDRDLLLIALEERIAVLKTAMEDQYFELSGAALSEPIDYVRLNDQIHELLKVEKEEKERQKKLDKEANQALQDQIDRLEKEKKDKAEADRLAAVKAEPAESKTPDPIPVEKPEKKLVPSSIPAVDLARIQTYLIIAEKSATLTGGPLESEEAKNLVEEFGVKVKELINELKAKLK